MNPYDAYGAEREIPKLTDEVIRKDLKEIMYKDVMGTLVMAVMSLLLAFLMSSLVLYSASHILQNGVAWVMVACVWLAEILSVLYYVRRHTDSLTWLTGGSYHVVRKELATISRHEYQGMQVHRSFGRIRRSPVYRDVFYFSGMGKYFATEYALNRAREGEEFYVVVFDKKPTHPVLVYRTDAYRWP